MKQLIFAIALTTLAFIAFYNLSEWSELPEPIEDFFIMTEEGEFVPSDPAGNWVFNTTARNPDVTIYGDGPYY